MMSGIHSTNSNIPTTSGLTQTQSFILSAVSPGPTGRPVRPVDWRTDTPRPPGRRRSINHSRDGGLNPFRVRAAQISRFANRNRRHSGHPYTCLSEVEFPIRLLPPFGSVALYACKRYAAWPSQPQGHRANLFCWHAGHNRSWPSSAGDPAFVGAPRASFAASRRASATWAPRTCVGSIPRIHPSTFWTAASCGATHRDRPDETRRGAKAGGSDPRLEAVMFA
jgi:hypothetical protein